MKSIVKGQLFHGTKGENLESILKNGLTIATKPKMGASQHFPQYYFDGVGSVCLTNHLKNAIFYAVASYPTDEIMDKKKELSYNEDFCPIVVVIDESKIDKNFLSIRGKASQDGNCELYTGRKEMDYIKDISPDAIIGYWKFNKEKKVYDYFEVKK